MTDKNFEDLMKFVDPDGSGEVSYNEFMDKVIRVHTARVHVAVRAHMHVRTDGLMGQLGASARARTQSLVAHARTHSCALCFPSSAQRLLAVPTLVG